MMNNIDTAHVRQIAGLDALPKLTDKERATIADAYQKLFTAFTYANLIQKKPLGQSWYNANRQVESYIATQSKYNPAMIEMCELIACHRKDLSKTMMTHRDKDCVMNVAPAQVPQIQKQIADTVKTAMASIGDIVKKYQNVAEKLRAEQEKLSAARQELNVPELKPVQPIAHAFNKAAAQVNQLSQQQLLMQILYVRNQNQHQRVA